MTDLEKIGPIFTEALGKKDPHERAAYLEEVCRDDLDLREKVEILLRAHEKAGDFLESPPFLDQAPLNDHPAESPGTIIDKYKLLEKIGEGGMAVVYMAQQEQPLRRQVALKIIKLGMDTQQVIARFEVERQALAMMDHPNIAKVLDAGATDSGRPYFVMDLVKGVPITTYCDENNLSTTERLRLFMSVCEAIQHAHQKGIIHRDIKPSNVLVQMQEGRPVPKVIDFGIAKAVNQRLTEKMFFTRFEQLVGTPECMSPEQAEWGATDIDTRTDIYSLGVLLYELLTGTTPFDSQKLREAGYDRMLEIIRQEEPTKPSTILDALGKTLPDIASHRKSSPEGLKKILHGDLDWIIMKSLEKDRTGRYATASEFAADINRHLRNEPVTAAAPSVWYRVHRFIRRHRLGVTAASLVVGALVLGAMGTTLGLIQANSQHKQAVLNFQKACENLSQLTALIHEYVDEGISEEEQSQRLVKVLEYAVEFFQSYLVEFVDDLAIRQELALTHKQIGQFNVICKNYEGAELAYSKAIELFEQLAERNPEKEDLQKEVAYNLGGLGFSLEWQGQQEMAKKFYEKSQAMWKHVDGQLAFGTPKNIGTRVNSKFNEIYPSISADKLSLYFNSNRPGGPSQNSIWVAHRKTLNDDWSEPVSLGPMINCSAWDGNPCISADGLELFFQSIRHGGYGTSDIWVARRETPDGEWSDIVNLGPFVNTLYREGHPCVSSDGLSLYIRSNRPGGLGASDLWVASRKSRLDLWSEPVNLGPTINSYASESYPSISSDGLILFFGSTRRGGFGAKTDLWVAIRSSPTEQWGLPDNLGPPVNSVGREQGPSISVDGRTLYFSTQMWPGNIGDSDIWEVPILSTQLHSRHTQEP